MSRSDPLPREAVRDLLGITRALYAAKKREGASEPDLGELAEIGKMLARSLELSRRTAPDTVGHRSAWTQAEDATNRLVRLIPSATRAAPLVEAAAIRFRRIGPRPTDAEERRSAARRRG